MGRYGNHWAVLIDVRKNGSAEYSCFASTLMRYVAGNEYFHCGWLYLIHPAFNKHSFVWVTGDVRLVTIEPDSNYFAAEVVPGCILCNRYSWMNVAYAYWNQEFNDEIAGLMKAYNQEGFVLPKAKKPINRS